MPTEFQLRRAAQMLHELPEQIAAIEENMPQGVSASAIALAELSKGIEENAVGRCHLCGNPTANEDMIGAACHTGLAKEPEERCRGYIHPLDPVAVAEQYFRA